MKRLLSCVVLAFALSSSAQESASVIAFLNSIKTAGPPVVVDRHLVLTATGPWRHVAAAFEHERYARLYSYARNGYGVFVLSYALPEHDGETPPLGEIRYRLVVDGAWTWDPFNPDSLVDAAGVRVSRYAFKPGEEPDRRRYGAWNPGLHDDGYARFRFIAPPGEYVTVVGDFSGWDPFIYRMPETSPGVYELKLPMPAGEHLYAFYYRGMVVPDPLNSARLYSKAGAVYSWFLMPPRRS